MPIFRLSLSLILSLAFFYAVIGSVVVVGEEVTTTTTTTTEDGADADENEIIVDACAAALEALSIDDANDDNTNIFKKVIFAVHRSGEPEHCGMAISGVEALRTSLHEMGLCVAEGEEIDRYQLDALLTMMFIKGLGDDNEACGSTDNSTAPVGLEGWCDMGPERTVIQNDHDQLVRMPGGSLPCRFYTREGLRVDSLSTLMSLATKAEETEKESCVKADDDNNEQKDGTCGISALHLYAVPAGRMFMFAPAYIGEKFIIDHMTTEEDGIQDTIVVEVINLQPRVFELYSFFSVSEARTIIERAEKDNSKVYGLHRSTTGSDKDINVFSRRTSENAWDVSSKEAVALKKRCLKFLGFDDFWMSHTDGIQILRYRNGQAYVSHADYLDQPKTENYNYDTAGVGGNRYATILLYMTDLGEHDGGETVFKYAWPLGTSEEEKKVPLMKTIQEIRESGDMGLLKEGSWEEEMTAYCRTRLAIRPRAGRAVLFYSQDPNGEEDKYAAHGACPVLNGTKWAANLWVWSGPRPEYALAPRLWPEDSPPSPKEVRATFVNTKKDPRFNENTRVYFEEDSFFGNLGPNDPAVSVNTYKTHVWNIKVNGETLKTFEITSEEESQTFKV